MTQAFLDQLNKVITQNKYQQDELNYFKQQMQIRDEQLDLFSRRNQQLDALNKKLVAQIQNREHSVLESPEYIKLQQENQSLRQEIGEYDVLFDRMNAELQLRQDKVSFLIEANRKLHAEKIIAQEALQRLEDKMRYGGSQQAQAQAQYFQSQAKPFAPDQTANIAEQMISQMSNSSTIVNELDQAMNFAAAKSGTVEVFSASPPSVNSPRPLVQVRASPALTKSTLDQSRPEVNLDNAVKSTPVLQPEPKQAPVTEATPLSFVHKSQLSAPSSKQLTNMADSQRTGAPPSNIMESLKLKDEDAFEDADFAVSPPKFEW